MKYKYFRIGIIIIFLFSRISCKAGDIVIKNNPLDKILLFGNSKVIITLDYNEKCNISGLSVNGQSVISGPSGIFSAIKTASGEYSTLKLTSVP